MARLFVRPRKWASFPFVVFSPTTEKCGTTLEIEPKVGFGSQLTWVANFSSLGVVLKRLAMLGRGIFLRIRGNLLVQHGCHLNKGQSGVSSFEGTLVWMVFSRKPTGRQLFVLGGGPLTKTHTFFFQTGAGNPILRSIPQLLFSQHLRSIFVMDLMPPYPQNL